MMTSQASPLHTAETADSRIAMESRTLLSAVLTMFYEGPNDNTNVSVRRQGCDKRKGKQQAAS
jgi:hypothetical protein